ncbi:hypothetical protein EPD60_09635 [Flaviaesturariibacter flavus]|uniref:Oxygen sensor histidine kinase NreB n=1 Tax=Flaviaesturariibacter flavus TaxID=2502780 RepID=A0A4R1BBB4_9BACT|nr:ATP-binding protein [Flaviaesturariibacter flavus]TCJ14254.1 hypothetical protein EPD60_09635 [Flaviaesturariibacter flavus]
MMLESMYEKLFNAAPVPLIITDRKGTIKLANEQVDALLDNRPTPLTGLSFFDFIDQSVFKNYFQDQSYHSFEDFLEVYRIHPDYGANNKGGIATYKDISVASFQVENEIFYIWTLGSTEITRKLKHDLNERVKEQLAILNVIELCFQNQDIHTSLQRCLQPIREGWQFPYITEVRITLENGAVFATDNFRETEWCLRSEIKSANEFYGYLEVCYLHEAPVDGGEVFLYEEERLIRVLGKIIGAIIEHWHGNKRMNEAVVNAQEEERYQLAMELHDNVQQILTAASLNVGFLQSIHTEGTSQEVTQKLIAYLSEAIQELRRLSQQLAPSVEPAFPLAEKIDFLIRSMNVNGRLNVKTSIDPELLLDEKVQLGFYRIIQEQLTNIIKHAKTSEVEISIKTDWNAIILGIADHGVGFDVNSKKIGIGLENIRRRSELMNGSLDIASSPGKGTQVAVTVPMVSRHQ